MADIVQVPYQTTGMDLYFHVNNSSGYLWNGSSFEAYDAGSWTDYDVAMSERGASRVYAGAFPAAIEAGNYGVVIYLRAGATPAETDLPVAAGDVNWDGTGFADISDIIDHGDTEWATGDVATIAAAILTTPANKLGTNASGQVAISNSATVGAAVWAVSERTLSTYGTLVADIATAVWLASERTLTAFTINVTSTVLNTVAATVAKLEGMLELVSGNNRWKATALATAPSGGDATAANQTSILAAVAALNDLSGAEVTALMEALVIDGSDVGSEILLPQALQELWNERCGKVVRTSTNPIVYEYRDQSDATLFSVNVPTSGAGRTRV